MHLLLFIGISVFVLNQHHGQSVYISNNKSLTIKESPRVIATKWEMKENNESVSSIANTYDVIPAKWEMKESNESVSRIANTYDVIPAKWEMKANNESSSRDADTNVTSSQHDTTVNNFQQIPNDSDDTQLRNKTSHGNLQPNPCSILYCDTETTANCADLSLVDLSPDWFPKNTTVLLLDNNNIVTVDNSSFSDLTQLRILSLSNNKIKLIQENAFKQLGNLEILNLEVNQLKRHSFPPGIFDPLYQLKTLLLMKNKQKDSLPGNLLKKLDDLNILSMDAVGDTFSLDKLFTHLTKLVLTGNVKTIDHTSFTHVPFTRELIIDNLDSISHFTDTALKPLHNLDILTVTRVRIGVEKSLQILKPLAGTNMTSISFSHVFFNTFDTSIGIYDNRGILNAAKTQYLLQICVEHFSLINSRIFVLQMNTFTSETFKRCLRSLDLSFNRIIGSKFAISMFLFFHNIEIINLENDVKGRDVDDSLSTSTGKKSTASSSLTIHTTSCSSSKSLTASSNVSGRAEMNGSLIAEKLPYQDPFQNEVFSNENMNSQILLLDDNSECPSTISPKEDNLLGYIRLHISKTMTHFKGRAFLAGGGIKNNAIFVGGSGLRYVDIRDCGMKEFVGNVIGLNRLQTLLLSGNDVSNLSKTFFDGMCHLTVLDLSNCRLDVHFMSSHSARLLQKLLDLKRVDLSNNLLNHLEPRTFESNNQIEVVNLSKNRFTSIPYNLRHTPKIVTLDLQANSLTTLESPETDDIDRIVTQSTGFRLLIAGNILSCGCNNLRFLIWLQTTRANLDAGRHFTCINDEGQLTYITDASEIDMIWRKCWGRSFLPLSLILLCCIAVGFLSFFSVWKNKTFIKSKILNVLTGYKLKTSKDYHTGVFIGYAEKDYNFPCFVLRKYIEEELSLKTYVYNRDNIVNSDRATSIVDAINGSWRIILVITDNFLCGDEWSMFTTRAAIYGLSPANPARVVVLVPEDLQYRIPTELLSSVPEENILVLYSWTISDDLRRQLRICLKEL